MYTFKDRHSTRHLSLSDNPLDPQLLRNHYRRLFPNDQRSRVRVRGDVARTDGQVCDLESLDAIYIQTRIDDATPRARLHRAGAELDQSSFISARD